MFVFSFCTQEKSMIIIILKYLPPPPRLLLIMFTFIVQRTRDRKCTIRTVTIEREV